LERGASGVVRTGRPAGGVHIRQGLLRVADLVYVPTQEGVLYPGVVLDVWSRRVVGWAMRPAARAGLVEMALWRRRPVPGPMHHSDSGAQYTSPRFGVRLRAARILPPISRGRPGKRLHERCQPPCRLAFHKYRDLVIASQASPGEVR
jgi:transposase InsO family protein